MPLVNIPASPLCPKAAILDMFARVWAYPQGPAFHVLCCQGLTTLTHASFTHHLRCLLYLPGHHPTGFSGHTFQRGRASFTFLAGVPGELIMSHGDWQSQCYLHYLDRSMQDQTLVSKMMPKACVS